MACDLRETGPSMLARLVGRPTCSPHAATAGVRTQPPPWMARSSTSYASATAAAATAPRRPQIRLPSLRIRSSSSWIRSPVPSMVSPLRSSFVNRFGSTMTRADGGLPDASRFIFQGWARDYFFTSVLVQSGSKINRLTMHPNNILEYGL